MLVRAREELTEVVRRRPFHIAVVAALTGVKIALDISAPPIFVAGFDHFNQGEKGDALWRFGLSCGLFLTSANIPPLQEIILADSGGALSTRLMRQAAKTFFMIPEEILYPGDQHRVTHVNGYNYQPEGVGWALLPVIVDATTGLFEIIALNGYMWHRLGKVTSLSTAQSILFLACMPGTKYMADKFLAYIGALYQSFSNKIVFAGGYETNRILGQQQSAIDDLIQYDEDNLTPKMKKTLHTNAYASMVAPSLGWLVFFGQLAWAVQKDLLDRDELFILLFYALLLLHITSNLTQTMKRLISAGGLFYEVLKYIEEGSAPSNAKNFSVNPEDTSIKYKKVSYSYPKEGTKVFEDFSLEIGHKEVIAIVGGNGNGKSTLLKLLCGFVQPDSGQVLLSDQDIDALNPESTQSVCSIIPQNPAILRGTFKKNISCRCPGASDQEIRQAMNDVGLPEFKLDDVIELKLDLTPKISGGQTRRVEYARLLLEIRRGISNFVLLDEPTNDLDDKGRDVILTLLKNELKNRNITTVVITHDLKYVATKLDFNRVISLEKIGNEPVRAVREVDLQKFLKEKMRLSDNRYATFSSATSPAVSPLASQGSAAQVAITIHAIQEEPGGLNP